MTSGLEELRSSPLTLVLCRPFGEAEKGGNGDAARRRHGEGIPFGQLELLVSHPVSPCPRFPVSLFPLRQSLASAAAALALLGLALLGPTLARADAGPELRHDPFARPALLEPKPPAPKPAPKPRETTEESRTKPTAPPPAPPWEPELRGTLVAGEGSLVNVDGVIVAVGEEFEGYRLLEVREGEAVFAKDEIEIVLALYKDVESETDEQEE